MVAALTFCSHSGQLHIVRTSANIDKVKVYYHNLSGMSLSHSSSYVTKKHFSFFTQNHLILMKCLSSVVNLVVVT